MDEERVLKPIERFLELVKGTEYEEQALRMKMEIEEVIDEYNLDLRAAGERED
ncbi:hypothetical protein U1P98_18585 [Lysinibacillus irui]|uniref:Uncharacterized protein n=1 Tax=Lysinibacillus irui TaxID=2998077 RepID=A0ABU5NQL4_9BACI|nr:hypothetical protein [Lysinibacillus irui]MEA0556063.1 hypothetical protein [Lysinibacillus irui]MEA0978317.1 hypothetical protein [Lysinibacillus irui]MEA1044471.1 hypothetical protein [Lysinibacillus irui]